MRTVGKAMKKRAISWLEEFFGTRTKNSNINDRIIKRKTSEDNRDRHQIYSIMTFSTTFNGDKSRFSNEKSSRYVYILITMIAYSISLEWYYPSTIYMLLSLFITLSLPHTHKYSVRNLKHKRLITLFLTDHYIHIYLGILQQWKVQMLKCFLGKTYI